MLIVGCLFLSACASIRYSENLEDYDSEVADLQARISKNPADANAMRDLGVIYLRTHNDARAFEQLQRAYALDSTDPATMYYLGMASEMVGKRDTAIRLYGHYIDVPSSSDFRSKMQGRQAVLEKDQVHAEVRALLANEATMTGNEPSAKVVAVFPLTYHGGDEQYQTIGRGLGEMLTVDLANVSQLKVVERIRVQTLLDELKLAESQFVDSSTAPRVGRLIGAGRVVGGSYSVMNKKLSVDAAIVDLANQSPPTLNESDALTNFFRLEKQLAFSVIRELGVELTPEERETIERIPTKNLQAFLAYSRGLEREDAGDLKGAASRYQQAGKMDPTFEAATSRAETVETMSDAMGTPQMLLSASFASVSPPSLDLVGDRIQTMNTNLGSSFVPGQDARTPTRDGLGELPLPPRPPDNR